jgi:NADPH-dependent 2,4-dienoyl-CoA reductase/sulfur reductase-like enzyme
MVAERTELVVVGAGPAGLTAAIEAARAGVDVAVVDENRRPGGQIFRQLPDGFAVTDGAALGTEFRRGQQLLGELAGLPIRFLFGSLVWGIFEDRVLEVIDDDRSFRLGAEAIVIATGAYDRPVPLPGWTLPGVFSVGGAQTLLKSQRLLAGRRILMAGTGPLQLVVASQLAKAGGEIVAIADAVPTHALLRHVWPLIKGWSLTRDGIGYRWDLLKARVPWIAPSILVRVEGEHEVERAAIATVDADWRPISGTERTFEVDTVCIGYGLLPSVELARLCGCDLRYDEATDTWLPERDGWFETNKRGIYAVGDGAGIAGAAVAADEGRIAGLAVASRLGRISDAQLRAATAAPRRRLHRLGAFRAAMDAVYRVGLGLHELALADTIVCRCEEVRCLDVQAAIDDGAATLSQVKAWTRAGMGSCQGRMCSLPIAHVIARRTGGDVEAAGVQTALVPAKPVAIRQLLTDTQAE